MRNPLIEEVVLNLNKYDPEEIVISIDRADFRAVIPYVDITIQISLIDEVDEQKWKIYFIGYLAGCLSSSTSFCMDFTKDHPLLWDYNDLQASLYFTGLPDNFYKLYWDLHHVHTSLYGSYFKVEKHLNAEKEFEELMKSNYGLLANGPKRLLVEFAECLKRQGVKSSIINERKPTFWNGQRIVSELRNPSLLLIGESYIVTDEFKLERI